MIAAVLSILIFNAFGANFRVALPGIPAKLKPRSSQMNISQYISVHLYYPLLEQGQNGIWDSHFLDIKNSQAINTTFDEYQMCLRPNLHFSDETEITTNDLSNALRKASLLNSERSTISNVRVISKNCLIIKLNKPDKFYFSHLQGLTASVIKSETEDFNFPIGLGPYKVTSVSAKKIALKSLDNKVPFSEIEFEKYSPGNKSQYDDLNIVAKYYSIPIPPSFVQLEAPINKTYSLVLNVSDELLRKCIAQNINRDELIKNLRLNLINIPGFLPIGSAGFSKKYQKPFVAKCRNQSTRLSFITPFHSIYRNLKENKKKIFANMSNSVDIKFVTAEKFQKIIFSKNNPYIAVIGFDTSRSSGPSMTDTSTFFESFYSEERIIQRPLIKLKSIVDAAEAEFDAGEKELKFENAHSYILNTYYVIPLGQLSNIEYYPNVIKKIVWADYYSGYPQINLMETE